MSLTEGRPPVPVMAPAGRHQVVRLPGTPVRPLRPRPPAAILCHDVTSGGGRGGVEHALQVAQDVGVAERRQRSIAGVRQDLPQRHPERPHIALRRVLTLQHTSPVIRLLGCGSAHHKTARFSTEWAKKVSCRIADCNFN